MKARIASTLVLWFTVVAVLYFGKAWGGLAILVLLGGAAQWEFYGMLEKLGAKPRKTLGIVLGAVLPIVTFMKGSGVFGREPQAASAAKEFGDSVRNTWHDLTGFGSGTTLPVGELRRDMLVFTLIGVAIAAVFFVQLVKHTTFLELIKRTPTMFGVLGFPFMMALYTWPAGIHWARNGDLTGVYWVVWCAAATKFTDVGALLAGKAFGKNKLWPAVSPGKTWEGCIGGVLTSCAVGAGISMLFAKLDWTLDLSPAKAALIALPLAIFSVPSDLVESVFKRLTGLKDSGRTIPGIGGAYDLVDSLLLTAPVSLALYLVVTA
jgi:phosphatidate cytidylyltransferase